MTVRVRNIFDPKNKKSYKISRSKIELFINCPRCFYLDHRLGISRPSGPPFNLNKTVDELLKKEFDIHRAKGVAHPLMKAYKLKAVPFAHEKLNTWRENFTGIQYYHKPTNFIVYGAVDDIWINNRRELIIVDYKATSTAKKITLDDYYKQAYKRQMEIYQWLMRCNGFKVANTGYFVFCNATKDRKAFDAKLEFSIELIPYKGSDAWVEKEILRAHKCLKSKIIPKAKNGCEYCAYINDAKNII